MIHIKPRLVVGQNACEDAIQTAKEACPKYGVDFNSWVPLPVVYEVLGLYNTLFALCGCKQKEIKEVSQKTRLYMASVGSILFRYIVVADPSYEAKLKDSVEAINKRCRGLNRRPLLKACSASVRDMVEAEKRPHVQNWLKGIGFLLSEHEDNVAACHATMKLVLGADIVGIKDETFTRCRDIFNEAFGL